MPSKGHFGEYLSRMVSEQLIMVSRGGGGTVALGNRDLSVEGVKSRRGCRSFQIGYFIPTCALPIPVQPRRA